MRRAIAGLVMLLAGAAPASAKDSCHPTPAGSLDMTVGSDVTVPITLGGQTYTVAISTGGPSLLSQAVLDSLGIHVQRLTRLDFAIYGGKRIENFAVLRDIDLGGHKVGATAFLVAPEGTLPEGIQGTIAPDVLRAYEIEFDFAHARLNLFEPDYCDGNPVYWTQDAPAELSFPLDPFGYVRFPVSIDGKEVKLEMATGMTETVIDLETAEKLFGFDANDPRLAKLGAAAYGNAYRFPFRTLSLGQVSIADPQIVLAERKDAWLGPDFHGMIGLSLLRRLHLYVSYHRHKVFITAADAH